MKPAIEDAAALVIPPKQAYDGKMQQNDDSQAFLDAATEAERAGEFIALRLSKPVKGEALRRVDIRPILVKRARHWSFTYHHATKDVVKNLLPGLAVNELTNLLPQFTHAQLYALSQDVLLRSKGSECELIKQPPSRSVLPNLAHDKPKARLIEGSGKPYLHALGITDAKGEVLKSAQDKFRQINKYIEILHGLLKDLPADKPLRIADMGAGKGYLTFALYDHLAHQRDVEMVGVELRPELVEKGNALAAEQGFSGLKFVEGSITKYDCSNANVVIALHACDTATDEALAKAIRAQAQVIVVAPCCHKQIRREMAKQAPGLEFLMRHGTYQERMGEMVTDALRAQILELHGYRIKLFEFISDAHTPKNVMITATRAAPLSAAKRAALEQEIAAAKAHFSIPEHALERLLKQA